MSQTLVTPSALDHYRSMAASLSDPRDVRVVQQYVAELEQRSRVSSLPYS